MKLKENDDETFLRALHQIYIDPQEEAIEGLNTGYMLAIEEKQSFYIFNEVAKESSVDNLCLPFIFKMKVKKGHDESHSLAAMINQADV